MPQELADALDALHPVSRQAALDGWEAIGPEGRSRYRRYLHGHSHRARRERAELAAEQLQIPDVPIWIPTGGPAGWVSLPAIVDRAQRQY